MAAWVLAAVAATAFTEAENSEASRVVILANAEDEESMQLAQYYAEARSIPEANIVALPMPLEETISWEQFSDSVFNPLLTWLIEHGWVDAVPGDLRDSAGRMRVAPLGHSIAYLVTCRGVPLRIENDPDLVSESAAKKLSDQFRTNRAAVDSELALLGWVAPDLNGFLPNPLFENRRPIDADKVVRVSRIDGPSLDVCRQLVDSALAGERNGVAGRAYIDLSGPHEDGDTWLQDSAEILEALHFDVQIHEAGGVFLATDRMEAPAFYFGWYAGDVTGPFRLPGFRFVPGAIAVHIHSYSATSLRDDTKGWVAPFVDRGVAGTIGNVYEPYLQLTHRPDLFLKRLSGGSTLGEAAYHALPVLSWQSIVVGDPLFRPFACNLEDQVESMGEREDPYASYVVLREGNRLSKTATASAVERWLEDGHRKHPGMALGLRLAETRFAAGRKTGAKHALAVFRLVPAIQPQEIALVAEAAAFMHSIEDHRGAVGLYRRVLDDEPVDPMWRPVLLPPAIEAAEAGRFSVQLKYWREALEALNAESVE